MVFNSTGNSSGNKSKHFSKCFVKNWDTNSYSPLISFLVNMSHSTQMFIDHFIHVIDQLERKMYKSELKRVYIVRPERKSIQKHFAKELGNKNKETMRISAQVVVVKSFDELYEYINTKNLTIDFGGTLQHDHSAWLTVQKMLTQYYLMVNSITTSLSDIRQRVRDLTSGVLGSRTPEKSAEHVERKRLRNIEKKKSEILRQYNFTKALEDGQRLRSYFQDPKLNDKFRALSKSPIFAWDKARFQKCYREMLAMKESIEHAWKEGVNKMTSLTTEQGLYDRLIECCTWIVDTGLPYLTSLPAQSRTLAEAVKQKITFENEFYKPVKVTLKNCRKTLKEVRHYQRSLRMSSGSLELMADNMTSLMENLKTKSEQRMERFKKEKDFMQSLAKAESWCERARDFWAARQTSNATHEVPSSSNDLEKNLMLFLERYPPLTNKDLALILDYVENIDDLELRNRARLLGDHCQKLERMLRARETHPVYVSSEEKYDIGMDFESSDDRSESLYGRNSSLQRRVHDMETRSSSRSTIPRNITTKRWHTPDDVMSSTMKTSNDDVSMSISGHTNIGERTEKGGSRLADIQRRLRDQELLYEQLILEEELRELDAEVSLGSSGSSGHENWNNIVNADSSEKASEKNIVEEEQHNKTELRDELGNLNYEVNPGGSSGKTLGNTKIQGKQDKKTDGQAELGLNPSVNKSFGHRNWDSMVKSNASKTVLNSDGEKKKTIDLDPTDSYCFRPSHKDSKTVVKFNRLAAASRTEGREEHERWTRSGETGKENEEEMPLDISSKLLAGCNSLKRLCEIGKPAAQNSSRDFGSLSRDPISLPRDHKNRLPDQDTISRDLENSSRGSEYHSCDFESHSCDLEKSPHDLVSCSHDQKNESRSCDSKDKSREEDVTSAREAVDHWTRIKNEQRSRLAQVIDDITARKEIEEIYFNAQLQLCRARQNFAKLSISNADLTTLSSNNEVINDSITSSFTTSSELRNSGDQMLNGDGAFRRFVKDPTSVKPISDLYSDSTETGYLQGGKEVLIDNENSLAMNGVIEGVEQDLGESLDSQDIFGDFNEMRSEKMDNRVRTQGNGGEVDSEDEQESSDEFDDEVEEEELMLLYSQSSSGLLSQDGLKDSLREEQEKLEEMFRQQKEQLRMEQEKLKEEEKRMDEWEKKKVELKGEKESLAAVNGNLSHNLENIESKSGLDKMGDDNKIGKSENVPQHEIRPPQHNLLDLQHDIVDLQHVISAPHHDKVALHNDLSAPHHEQTSPRNEQRPQLHKVEEIVHERSPINFENLPSHEKENAPHERIERKREIEEHLRRERKQLHEVEQPKIPTFNLVRQNDETNASAVAPNIDAKFTQPKSSSKETIHENVNIESDVKDLGEIFVSNFDSDEESRNKIEEELISILHETTLEMEGEKLEEKGEEFDSHFLPLGMDSNPDCMLSDSDGIDIMNQLIDDLMISDQDKANQDDDNGIDVDRTQLNADNQMGNTRTYMNSSGVNVDDGRVSERNEGLRVDNIGINFDDDDEINQGGIKLNVDNTDSISEDDVGLDVDNVGIRLDTFGMNKGDIDLGNIETNGDEPEMNVDNQMMDLNIPGTYFDDVGTNRDIFAMNGDNHEVNVDTTTLDVDYVRTEGKQKEVEHVPTVDQLEEEETSDHDQVHADTAPNEELDDKNGIDVDFAIDLGTDPEAVEGNDLIDLLRNPGDSFSSQESLDVDSVEFELSERGDKIVGARSDNASEETMETEARYNRGNGTLGSSNEGRLNIKGGLTSDVKYEIPNTKRVGTSGDDTRKATINIEARLNDGTSNQERFAVHKEQEGIPEGHQLQHDFEDIDNSNAKSEVGHLSMTEATGDINEKQARISGYTKEEGGITEDQGRIHVGHPIVQESEDSDNSDDDFGRVLEDIQEEESEYEDLMRYRGTHADVNENEAKEQAKIIPQNYTDLPTARLDDYTLNQENIVSSSFTSSIIIDPGTGYCKAGFSIDDQPRVVIPSVVGKPRTQVVNSGRYKDYYVGEEAKHLHQVLDLHHPLKNGLVQDWDLMEKLIDEIYEELRCESDQYPVLFSEPVLNPKSNREEMIQVMFETFHVPAAYSCVQAVLSLFATGRTTGLVYDCGYSKAHSVPVYEGYALPHATTTTELAGHELTTCLSRMLRDRGVSMESQVELDIVRDVKEKLCYVVMDYDSERKAYNIGERNDTIYTMPDGQTVAVGSERFRCPEVLFTPSMVGMATDGVHEVIYKTSLQCAIDVRPSLYQNIVITGGSTMFPGFSRRLHVELSKLLGTRSPESINIDAVDERNMLTWQGGAMLSKLSNFSSMWITSSEYEEFGPGIVHKKCV